MQKFSESQTQKIAKWLKVLAEPNRLLIFNQIMQGVECNCKLGLGLDLAPNLISHHLAVLRNASLIVAVHDKQDTRWIHYSINRENLKAIQETLFKFLSVERIQTGKPDCSPGIKEKQSIIQGVDQ